MTNSKNPTNRKLTCTNGTRSRNRRRNDREYDLDIANNNSIFIEEEVTVEDYYTDDDEADVQVEKTIQEKVEDHGRTIEMECKKAFQAIVEGIKSDPDENQNYEIICRRVPSDAKRGRCQPQNQTQNQNQMQPNNNNYYCQNPSTTINSPQNPHPMTYNAPKNINNYPPPNNNNNQCFAPGSPSNFYHSTTPSNFASIQNPSARGRPFSSCGMNSPQYANHNHSNFGNTQRPSIFNQGQGQNAHVQYQKQQEQQNTPKFPFPSQPSTQLCYQMWGGNNNYDMSMGGYQQPQQQVFEQQQSSIYDQGRFAQPNYETNNYNNNNDCGSEPLPCPPPRNQPIHLPPQVPYRPARKRSSPSRSRTPIGPRSSGQRCPDCPKGYEPCPCTSKPPSRRPSRSRSPSPPPCNECGPPPPPACDYCCEPPPCCPCDQCEPPPCCCNQNQNQQQQPQCCQDPCNPCCCQPPPPCPCCGQNQNQNQNPCCPQPQNNCCCPPSCGISCGPVTTYPIPWPSCCPCPFACPKPCCNNNNNNNNNNNCCNNCCKPCCCCCNNSCCDNNGCCNNCNSNSNGCCKNNSCCSDSCCCCSDDCCRPEGWYIAGYQQFRFYNCIMGYNCTYEMQKKKKIVRHNVVCDANGCCTTTTTTEECPEVEGKKSRSRRFDDSNGGEDDYGEDSVSRSRSRGGGGRGGEDDDSGCKGKSTVQTVCCTNMRAASNIRTCCPALGRPRRCVSYSDRIMPTNTSCDLRYF